MNAINVTYVEMCIHNICAVNIYDFQLYHINIIILCYYFILIITILLQLLSLTYCYQYYDYHYYENSIITLLLLGAL